MTTDNSPALPNTFAALAFAVASVMGMGMAMSGGRGDLVDGILAISAFAVLVLSTRYSIRTCRRLAAREFELAHGLRWLMVLVALAINGLECFMIAGSALLVVGMLLGGKGIA